jgi:hypothetical protein
MIPLPYNVDAPGVANFQGSRVHEGDAAALSFAALQVSAQGNKPRLNILLSGKPLYTTSGRALRNEKLIACSGIMA